MTKQELLALARANKTASGLLTADRFVAADPELSEDYPAGQAFDPAQLRDQASEKLTFLGETKMVEAVGSDYAGEDDLLLKRHCIVSTCNKDRDRDVMLPEGAQFKTKVLLWQHDINLPLGPVWGGFGHEKAVECDFGVCDVFNGLGKDATALVKAGALQMSHGFDPIDIGPAKSRDDRFLIKTYEIFEVSLVSVPANSESGPTGEAVMDLYSDGKFASEWVRKWAKGLIGNRKTVVNVPVELCTGDEPEADAEAVTNAEADGVAGTKQRDGEPITSEAAKCGGTTTCPKCGHKFKETGPEAGDRNDDDDDAPKGGMADKDAAPPAAKGVDASPADPIFSSLGL